MTSLPEAPRPHESPLPVGTSLRFDRSLTYAGDDVITGGHPWKVTRLNGAAMTHLRNWEASGQVEASTGSLARTLVDQGYVHPRFVAPLEISDVDIVIPVFNDLDGLTKILPALRGFHVTVVDDGSSIRAQIEHICRQFEVRYIRRSNNAGPGAARNTGMAATTRPFIWFLDADVLPGRLDASLAMLSPAFHDPRVAAVAPRICGESASGLFTRFDERFGPLDLGPEIALVVPGGSVSYVPTASLLVRRAACGSGFDESLRSAEDVDFVWRLHDAHWLVRYEPSVVMHHRPRTSVRAWLSQRSSYGQSGAQLAQRHPGRVVPVRIDALTATMWWAVATKRWRLAGAVLDASVDGVSHQLPESLADREKTSREITLKGIARSGLPLARALTRSYFPLLLVALAVRRTRRVAALILVAGTAERLRRQPPRASDAIVSLADDAAYSFGLWRGAWRLRDRSVITPSISWGTARSLAKRLASTGGRATTDEEMMSLRRSLSSRLSK